MIVRLATTRVAGVIKLASIQFYNYSEYIHLKSCRFARHDFWYIVRCNIGLITALGI
jgi:hypothetical protein